MPHEFRASKTQERSKTIARNSIAADATISLRSDHESAEDIRVGSQQQVFGIITGLLHERRYNRAYKIRQWRWSARPQTSFAREGVDQNNGSICLLGIARITSEDSDQGGTTEFDRFVVRRA